MVREKGGFTLMGTFPHTLLCAAVRRRLALGALVLAAPLLGFAPSSSGVGPELAQAQQWAKGCPGMNARQGARAARLQRATVCLINNRRHRGGRSRLAVRPPLRSAAKSHSRCMVRNKTFSHVCNGDLVTRVARTSYPTRSLLGETLAWGSGPRSTPLATVRSWLNSPPHRRIVLERRFRHIGVGVAKGSPFPQFRGGATYTAIFGRPV